jgi:hypothetical protein
MAQKVLLSGPFLFGLSPGSVTIRAFLRHAGLLVCTLVAASCANASSTSAADNEARLVGAWQKDLSPNLSQLPPEQRQKAARAGLLGAVIVYQADHRVEMYPPCGAKREALAAMGLQSVAGTWALSESGELAVSVDFMGKPMDVQSSLQWREDGQIVLRGLSNGSVDRFGRYDGPLPPAC